MFNSTLRSRRRSLVVATLLIVALGASGWSAVNYARSLPVRAHIDKGVELQTQGDEWGAAREWNIAVELDPSNVQGWELLGDLYLKQHKFPLAKDAFDQLANRAPDTADLNVRRCIVAYQLKDNAQARIFAQNQLKSDPNNIAALSILAKVEKDVHPDVYLDALQRLVKLQPKSTEPLLALMDELHTRDAYEKIIPVASQLIQLVPNSADAYARRGIAEYVANPASDSLIRSGQDLKKALQLDPRNIEAHRYLGRLYMRQNQPRLAISEFEAVGEGRPYASAHWLELSQAYRRIGETQRANALQARFLTLRESNTHWVNLSSQIERDPENSQLYLQLITSLLQRALGNDKDSYFLYSYQAGSGHLLSLQEYLDKATAIIPANPQLAKVQEQVNTAFNKYIGAGETEVRRGDYKQANEDGARAVLIKPQDPRTLRLTRQLQGAGFNPFPVVAPEASPGPHER